MVVILLEALLALSLLVLIVWWTMFSGRSNGELPDRPKDDTAPALPPPQPPPPSQSGPASGTGTGADDPAARS